jgi:peptidoglycan/xylan/chitin deacetylase (PgdA/CDA1 family)
MTQAIAKQWLGQGLFASRLNAVLLRRAAVIVMLHRVRETDGSDGLTIDVPTFERYCRYFARYFRVLPLRAIVDALERGTLPDRALAITFDDGYLDNYENAAPVLERLSLPATFFIVSQWIDSDVVPWWDARRGERHPWMTWSEVRSLASRGFEIGAHTRNHVDLGAVTRLLAEEEIRGARAELEDRLGTPVDSFAYPYGGVRHVTEAARSIVKAAGFRCCCSGFGGVNGTGTDPFHLRRVPISPRYPSPDQFGFDLALGRSVVSA